MSSMDSFRTSFKLLVRKFSLQQWSSDHVWTKHERSLWMWLGHRSSCIKRDTSGGPWSIKWRDSYQAGVKSQCLNRSSISTNVWPSSSLIRNKRKGAEWEQQILGLAELDRPWLHRGIWLSVSLFFLLVNRWWKASSGGEFYSLPIIHIAIIEIIPI